MKRALTIACFLLLVAVRTEAATPTPSPSPKPATVYDAGWVVSLHPVVEEDRRQHYKVRRDRLIGKFVENGNPFNLGAHHDEARFSFYKDPMAYTLNALFESKQSGVYTFVAEIGYPPTSIYRNAKKRRGKFHNTIDCDYRLLVGKAELVSFNLNTDRVSDTEEICGFSRQVVGSVELKPGLNEVTQEFGCIGPRKHYKPEYGNTFSRPLACHNGERFEADEWAGDEVTVTLRLRRPDEYAPTPAKPEDFFHITKPK